MFDRSIAVELLAALAHAARLEAFRALVRAGPDSLSAGALAHRLELRAAASFHLGRLRQVGLVRRRRAGRQLIYTANFEAMRGLRAFLDAECCAEASDGCGPECGDTSGAQGSRAKISA